MIKDGLVKPCPLNNCACDCDADHADKKQQPCKLARQVGKLIRMFSATEGEATAAVLKLRSFCMDRKISFNDIAILIENCSGEIEQLKYYSDADLASIWERAKERGREEGRAEQQQATEYFDADGTPQWYEIAVFCRDNKARLHRNWDQDFIEDIPGKIISYGQPTHNQAKQLLRIFVTLGGEVDAKVVRTYQ